MLEKVEKKEFLEPTYKLEKIVDSIEISLFYKLKTYKL
jgi:hypothetical protein